MAFTEKPAPAEFLHLPHPGPSESRNCASAQDRRPGAKFGQRNSFAGQVMNITERAERVLQSSGRASRKAIRQREEEDQWLNQ
jgi:hypothetical protein